MEKCFKSYTNSPSLVSNIILLTITIDSFSKEEENPEIYNATLLLILVCASLHLKWLTEEILAHNTRY